MHPGKRSSGPRKRKPTCRINGARFPSKANDCDHVKCWGQGVIQVDTPVREIGTDRKLHQYLEIRDNEFTSVDGELVNVKNIQTVIFVGNKVTAPGSEETWVKLEDIGEYRNK